MQALARFVTRFPWLVLGGWLALVLLAAPFARLAPQALSPNPGGVANAESTRVAALLEHRFGETAGSTILLVARSAYLADDPRFLARYDAFVRELRAIPGVARVSRFDAPQPYRSVSADRKVTLTLAQINLNDNAALERVRLLAHRQTGPLRIMVTGGQPIARDFTKFAEQDTKRSEFAALPLTGLVLLLVFGALVATGLPLAVGLMSITVALGGVYGLTKVMEVSTFAQSVITMIGLGAGIDYALLMVNRFREELLSFSSREAARRTLLTAGRSVAFSGLTVAIAMAALLVPPLAFVRSMGLGGVLTVLLTVLASLTALPAILALLGERVNSPRVLRLSWSQNANASAAWSAFARRVIARPWLAVTLSSAVLLLLALPALGMKLGYAGPWGLTPGVESRDALGAVDGLGAGGLLSSFEVVFAPGRAYDPRNAQVRGRFRGAVRDLENVQGVQAVISPFVSTSEAGAAPAGDLGDLALLAQRSVSRDRTLLRVTVLPTRNLRADEVDAFSHKLRTVLNQAGLPYLLGGAAVGGREFTRAIVGATPAAILAALALTFVLLAVAFRSLVLPLKSIVMNALTVAAAYGVVTLVVQRGLGAAWLGIPQGVGVLDSSLPLILFAVLFGLSMDYEIFLLSRFQEEHLAGQPNDEAIVRAVGRTGRVITSAALIMFIVFCAFISGRVVANKGIGLGLAVAVLLDATLVRMIFVPGFLKLAGRLNWWLPGKLARPHFKPPLKDAAKMAPKGPAEHDAPEERAERQQV